MGIGPTEAGRRLFQARIRVAAGECQPCTDRLRNALQIYTYDVETRTWAYVHGRLGDANLRLGQRIGNVLSGEGPPPVSADLARLQY